MRNLGITQRVEIVETHSERRDSLDQRWSVLANEMGFIPIPLPNSSTEIIPEFIKTLKLDAIISLITKGDVVFSSKVKLKLISFLEVVVVL